MLFNKTINASAVIPHGDPTSAGHHTFPFWNGPGGNGKSKFFTEPHSKIDGFFSWAGNHLSFADSHIAKDILYGLILLALILMLFFKEPIRNWVQKHPTLIVVGGWIGIAFFVLNRVLLIAGGYPLKWEIVPLHMCRLAVLSTLIMMAFNRHKHIKYIIFWAEIGAIIGLIYFHLNGVYTGGETRIDAAGHIVETGGKVYRNYTYSNVGLDSFFWWDYAFLHSFAMIAPVFLWVGLGIKVSWKEMWISIFWLWFMGTVAFVIDWIFKKQGVDYIYLSPNPTFKLPIPHLGNWPYDYFTYSFLFIVVINGIYGLWIIEGFFHFRKLKIHETNENWEHFKKTAPKWIQKRLNRGPPGEAEENIKNQDE